MADATHHGWERRPGAAWRRVEGCEGTKGACWSHLARRTMEVIDFPEGVEHAILPAGERPKENEAAPRRR